VQELKRYLDFCREERHYCALLAHALLSLGFSVDGRAMCGLTQVNLVGCKNAVC
jgi:hypothetical protein